jgi:hypothetical protein
MVGAPCDLEDLELFIGDAWTPAAALLPPGAAGPCAVLVPGAATLLLNPQAAQVEQRARAGAPGRASATLQWRFDVLAAAAPELTALVASLFLAPAPRAPRAPVAAASAETALIETISIRVLDADGAQIVFRLKPSTPFARVAAAYAAKRAVAAGAVALTFDGERVLPHQTPAHLGMEDGALVDAAFTPKEGARPGARAAAAAASVC